MQANGTVTKKRTSSIGRFINFIPERYFELNDQSPRAVAAISHKIYAPPVTATEIKMGAVFLMYRILLSKDKTNGPNNIAIFKRRYSLIQRQKIILKSNRLILSKPSRI